MSNIAIGVPIYMRETALKILLESVPEYVATVYVADNGQDQERELYEQDWPFRLEVLHLDHDCGIGRCREAIANAVDEAYLWMGDCDMEFTNDNDLRRLRSLLAQHDDLGAVAGWLIEDNVVRSGARDLEVYRNSVIKTCEEPELEGSSIPFARFDFIPQAALFRTEVFDDYCWDGDVRSTEHVDFMLGHKYLSEWDFASTPTVMIKHNRDINEEYRKSKRGGNHLDRDILEEKWGLQDTMVDNETDWGYLRGKSVKEQAFSVFKRVTPPKVWVPTKRSLERVIS